LTPPRAREGNMAKRPTAFIALLRGINVGGHHKIPMAELRSVCARLGWVDVQTYIQSGNVVFTSVAKPALLEAELEKAIERRFKMSIPVIVRPAASWASYIEGNPFTEVGGNEPKLLHLALAKLPPKPDAVDALRERAAGGERIERTGEALWIHFGEGVARSKLSPAVLDRLVGSPVTARNWRTVLKLGELAARLSQP